MADRAFERAFNKAAVGERPSSVKPKSASEQATIIPTDSEAQLRSADQPGQAQAVIDKILQADKDQDFFRFESRLRLMVLKPSNAACM